MELKPEQAELHAKIVLQWPMRLLRQDILKWSKMTERHSNCNIRFHMYTSYMSQALIFPFIRITFYTFVSLTLPPTTVLLSLLPLYSSLPLSLFQITQSEPHGCEKTLQVNKQDQKRTCVVPKVYLWCLDLRSKQQVNQWQHHKNLHLSVCLSLCVCVWKRLLSLLPCKTTAVVFFMMCVRSAAPEVWYCVNWLVADTKNTNT